MTLFLEILLLFMFRKSLENVNTFNETNHWLNKSFHFYCGCVYDSKLVSLVADSFHSDHNSFHKIWTQMGKSVLRQTKLKQAIVDHIGFSFMYVRVMTLVAHQ